jgi:ABC-type nitrate/sulfonate/bicarbonate transport system ATPase subunit
MKKYPSVWITKILKENPTREVWDISVKMNAELGATHFEKESKEEAINLSNRVIVLQPKPCRIYKVMDIEYDEEKPRDKWVFDTPQFNDYTNELTKVLEEVCV